MKNKASTKRGKISVINSVMSRVKAVYSYCCDGVWKDTRNNIWVKIAKTLNLSVRSFFDTELQIRAAALTYNTILSIVPAFALLFAIGRGFGFQDLLQSELYKYFPSQQRALSTALSFVDSYLAQASQGLFVGVGIVFLLWTLYSLLGNIETTFNKLWGITKQRTLYRKLTDYSAICLTIPVLMACSAGLSLFMSSTVQKFFDFPFLSPVISILLDAAPFILVWIAFTLSFLFIPNTKVNFKYAAISGFICGVAFQILQMLFLNGQIYVSKYNAIYGSFAFLPLMLIWLQFSWLILLFGCIFTYSLQNVFRFTYIRDIGDISNDFMRRLTVVIASILAWRTKMSKPPLSIEELSIKYDLPIRLTAKVVDKLNDLGIVFFVVRKNDRNGIITAVDLSTFTLSQLLKRVDCYGVKDFIPGFDEKYKGVMQIIDSVIDDESNPASKILLADVYDNKTKSSIRN